jgi:hypothetical protein
VKSLDNIHICVLGCAFHIGWCLAWLGFASVATTWGWNLVGIKEWFGLRVAASDVQLWECTIFLWMTKPTRYAFRAQLPAVISRERRFAQLPFTPLQDLIGDVYGVALCVHKCMKIADAATQGQ